jgi:hypothetical protein
MLTPDLWPLQQAEGLTAVPISGRLAARTPSLRRGPVSEVGIAESGHEIVALDGRSARAHWDAWLAENDPPPWGEHRWDFCDYNTGLGIVLEWYPKAWRRHLAEGNLEALRTDLLPFQHILIEAGLSAIAVFVLAGAIHSGGYADPVVDARARLWCLLWRAGQEIEIGIFRPDALRPLLQRVEDEAERLFYARLHDE